MAGLLNRPRAGAFDSDVIEHPVLNMEKISEIFMKTLVAAGLMAASTVPVRAPSTISGAGSTFVYPIMAKWADSYKKRRRALR